MPAETPPVVLGEADQRYYLAAIFGPTKCQETELFSARCGASRVPSAADPFLPSNSSPEPVCQTSALKNLLYSHTTGSGFDPA